MFVDTLFSIPSLYIGRRTQIKFRVAGTWSLGRTMCAPWKKGGVVSEGNNNSSTLCHDIYVMQVQLSEFSRLMHWSVDNHPEDSNCSVAKP
jgi:hypothetical protein